MDGLSHYLRGAQILADKDDLAAYYDGGLQTVAALANAHATLALAAVTALRGTHPDGELPLHDANAWFQVVSQAAPIPPETDDEPEDDVPRVGEIGPTGDMHPDALGAWLRALPHRTILRDIDGDPYQVSTGYETVHGGPDREFPALVELGGMPREITDGHPQLIRLAKLHAPFTVLYLGDETREGR